MKYFFSVFALLVFFPCVALADSKNNDSSIYSSTINNVFQAVIDSDTTAISRYLQIGGDTEVVGRAGMTPLALAVQLDKRKVVNLLISKGADLNIKTKDKGSLLHLASSVPVAKILLKKGLALDAVDKDGNTPLHTVTSKKLAAFFIAKDIAKDVAKGTSKAIDKGLSINTRNSKGRTVLHMASLLGNEETVKFLLARQADVNARDQYGKTPLFLAKKLEITQLLINNKADIHVQDSLGQTALHSATNKEILRVLVKSGADVNAQDLEGKTPLHTAAALTSGNKSYAEQLLLEGADIEARDAKGRTPLHVVDSLEVASFLLDLGALLYVKDNHDKTPLQLATERSNKKVADLFTNQLKVEKDIEKVEISRTKVKPIKRVRSSGSLQQKLDTAIAAKLIEKSKDEVKGENAPLMGPPKPESAASLVIPPRFEAAGAFHKGSAPVRVDGKWGLIDTKGEWILAPTFTEIGTNKEGLLPVKVDGKYGYIDALGTPATEFIYEAVKPFSEGLAAVKENGQWGFILPDGTKYLETDGFDDAGSFKNGVAPVKLAEGWGYALREWGEDKKGKQWLFFPFYQKVYEFSEGHGVVKVNHLMGLVDTEKNISIKPSFANMKKYSEGMLPVSKVSGQWFFVDNKGKTVIDDTFQNVSSFSEGLACVKKGGKWGFIDKDNKVVIPFKFDRAYDFHDGVAVAVSNKKRFFIDKQGRVLSENYDDVFRVSEGYAAVKIGDQWGYVYISTSYKEKETRTVGKAKGLADKERRSK